MECVRGGIMKKFNILDWFIIFIIIFVVAFGVCRIFLFGKSTFADNSKSASAIITDNASATVTFRTKNIRDIAIKTIKIGNECYDEKGNLIGEVSDFSVEPYYEYNLDANDQYVKSEFDNRFTLDFTLNMTGRETKSGFNATNLSAIGVGSEQYIVCNGIKLETVVTDIKVEY